MIYKNIKTINNYIYIIIISIISIIISYLFIKDNYYITGITLLILFIYIIISYLFISYELGKCFIVRFGLIKMKFNYKNITKVVKVNNKIKVSIGYIDFIINTIDNDVFYKELRKKAGIK